MKKTVTRAASLREIYASNRLTDGLLQFLIGDQLRRKLRSLMPANSRPLDYEKKLARIIVLRGLGATWTEIAAKLYPDADKENARRALLRFKKPHEALIAVGAERVRCNETEPVVWLARPLTALFWASELGLPPDTKPENVFAQLWKPLFQA